MNQDSTTPTGPSDPAPKADRRRLQGKVAVITGASSGIGLATAELFVSEGARVIAADIAVEQGAALERRFDGQVKFQACDVTCEEDLKKTMRVAVDYFGGLDILFNNAGAGGGAVTIEDMTGAAWDGAMNLLLRGAALGTAFAVPHMKERGGGSIVNTSSVGAFQAGLASVAYSVAKAGVLHLTTASAMQLARYNIRVNAICPGMILTGIFTQGMRKRGVDDQTVAQMNASMREIAPRNQPLHRAGMPSDVANACLYFASEESSFVTGAHLVVDGGLLTGPRQAWDPEALAQRMAELRAGASNAKT